MLNLLNKALLIALLPLALSCSYLPEPLEQEEQLHIEETGDYIALRGNEVDPSLAGIIFYPGGLVDPHSYINSLDELAINHKRLVVIVKSEANLSILNTQKGSVVQSSFPEVGKWVIGGHSLGGSVTCMDVAKNPEKYKGIFMLASYSVDNLSDLDLPVISITGTNDKVLDWTKFNGNQSNLPPAITVIDTTDIRNNSTSASTVYYSIEGANHAQFGSYGPQDGDGTPTISPKTQQSLVIDALETFLITNHL
ncbi:alpha/beta hydrolase [Parvicella tangerina]|uniref:Alpha/beta hydrolase fold-5 domain-containing protein n=1 Tax=Parvicella tangerina TaxID=2829795 RepID=A0A916NB10_9FLAO|nr:alpha/beta hydrolase [Parvicella tangerina]CAG5080153.1 hypothetical protein CRYO30217_01201 [Parvicella tangerina]